MSKVQKEFLEWFEAEKVKGLKSINIYPGDVSQSTVDSFLEEFMEINRAIENGNHSPFPENF